MPGLHSFNLASQGCQTLTFSGMENADIFHLLRGFSSVVVQALSCVLLFVTPIDCSPPGSSVHGILQARMLEWVAISFARGSSQPRDQTCVSCIPGTFF